MSRDRHLIGGECLRADGGLLFEGRLRAWLEAVQEHLEACGVQIEYEYFVTSDPSPVSDYMRNPCPPANAVCRDCNMLCMCDYRLMVAVGWKGQGPPEPPEPVDEP